jgi:2-polyprenyl-6-methoxyphenol hydroxylase-like FAD-dependent oxidoreductase
MEAKRVDVIIAGAGPTGLMLACQLSRLGVDFLILDKKDGPTVESRALVVQARSMEIYEQMGLSKDVERDGQASSNVSFYKDGHRLLSVSLGNMGEKLSPFPYVMIYEQSNNERLLYNDLRSMGRDVQWQTGIQDVREVEGGFSIQIHPVETAAPASQTVGHYTCTWLIACDGSKSKIRERAGVDFIGGMYENIFFVADTHVKGGDLTHDGLSLFFTRDSISILFPMAGDQRFRVLGILPKEYYDREDIQFADITGAVRENLQLPVEFYDTQWYSTYKLYYKKVARFNKGNIFFAGDAAHVHSPAGGQGMNTGLQDAYNLAWKLALVANGEARKELLDTYHEERNPIAERLLKTTDRMFSVMIGSSRFFGFVKLHILPRILPLISRSKKLRTKVFAAVSQIKISYTDSSLSLGIAGRLKAGERLPWFQIEQNGQLSSIFSLVRELHKTPFLVLLYAIPETGWVNLSNRLFTVYSLETTPLNGKALEEAGFPAAFVAVLRPDIYLGYLSETADPAAFVQLLRERYFITF